MFVQMWRMCLGAILTLMLLLPVLPAQAQGLGTLLTPTESASDGQDYDQILKSAAENGVSVVVIDSDGNIITQGGKAESEATDSERDSAALMKAQSSAVEFRAALVERLLNLPAAFLLTLTLFTPLSLATPDAEMRRPDIFGDGFTPDAFGLGRVLEGFGFARTGGFAAFLNAGRSFLFTGIMMPVL